MKKIIVHCEERELYYRIKNLSAEMGEYFYKKNAFKKSALYFHQAFQIEK